MFLATIVLAALVTAEDLPSTDGRVVIIVAVIGLIGAPLTAMIQVRGARREAAEAKTAAQAAAASVGPMNGHGTVQDATGVLIAESREWRDEIRDELRATRQTVEVLVTSADTVNGRLKAHDRELAGHRRDLTEHHRRISAIETTGREKT